MGYEITLPGSAGRAFLHKFGQCKVIVSQDPMVVNGVTRLLWHMSISRPDHYPSWDEIKGARYTFLPTEKTFAMIFPPPEEYVNVHPNCFHLHEIDGDAPQQSVDPDASFEQKEQRP